MITILIRGIRFLAILLGGVIIIIALVNLLGFIPAADGNGKDAMPLDYRLMESIFFIIFGIPYILPYKNLKKGLYYLSLVYLLLISSIIPLLFLISFFETPFRVLPLRFIFLSISILLIVLANIWAFFWIRENKPAGK